jgi:hypothetical protein
LNLETSAGIAKGGESGGLVVPGDPSRSLLFEKIHNGEMPPKEKGRLSEAEVKGIERWIQNGARVQSGYPVQPNAFQLTNQHDVIPISVRRCRACHGRHPHLAILELRCKSSMLIGGQSGPVIVLVEPEESLLVKGMVPMWRLNVPVASGAGDGRNGNRVAGHGRNALRRQDHRRILVRCPA